MLVCDRCEGRDGVERISVAFRVGEPRFQDPAIVVPDVASGDICARCREGLKGDITEFFRPLPKETNS